MALKRVMRIGDQVQGTCNAHGTPQAFIGTFTTGSSIVLDEGKGVVRIGDTGTTDCGHTIRALTGSPNAKADGIAIHRIDDTGEVIEGGTYTATTSVGDATTQSD